MSAPRLLLVLAFLGVFALVAAPAARAESANALKTPAGYTRNVAIVLYEGVELLDFAGPGEVFEAAGSFGESQGKRAFNVYTVAVSKKPLKSQRFLTVTPDYSIDDAPKPDLIVIPGGQSGNLTQDARFMAWAKNATEKGEILLTVCSGAFVPAQAGLLDGKSATTWYGAVSRLRELTPKANVVDGRRFIDNGSIITTAGVSAGIDGALHVVARLLGRQIADQTARYMEYHWTPEPYLSVNYASLNPSLDDRGREIQQGQIFENEGNYVAAAKTYRAVLDRTPDDPFLWSQLGQTLAAAGQPAPAIEALERASKSETVRARALYNLACVYATTGRKNDALTALEGAVKAGFAPVARLTNDPDLASVRDDARFKKLVAGS
ncbi:MAG TPA: DJ-1/PfpI family protein [Candidatus Polarisedimenticolia bacterium]|nr:DJ-1/PfpI family protein [Candidatus Polarisedimenticolia bacterium]